MITAAIVGLGKRGKQLVESVQFQKKPIRFATAATRTPASGQEFARMYGLELTADYASVLADPRIQAVVIATPNSAHAEQVLAAARAGKHVFCEKPLVFTVAEAETCLEALAKARLVLGVGWNRRFSPSTIEVRSALASGSLGKVVHVEGSYSYNVTGNDKNWRASRSESPLGAFTSLGLNYVDLFSHLFGRIEEVEARMRRQAISYDIDDTTTMFLRFASGHDGYLATVGATATLRTMRVFGTKGWIDVRDHHHCEKLLIEGTQVDGMRETRTYPGFDYPALTTVADELEAFAAAIEGTAPFPVTPEDTLHVTAVMEAIIASARSGRPVRVAR